MKTLRPRLALLLRHWPTACIAIVVTVILIHEAPKGHADLEPLSVHPYVQQVAHIDGTDQSVVEQPIREHVGA